MLARYHIVRPVSSCCAERVFSYLTQMDVPTRLSMTRSTLHDSLFVRANASLVDQMLAEEAHMYTEQPRDHPSSKRPRDDEVARHMDLLRGGGGRHAAAAGGAGEVRHDMGSVGEAEMSE